MTQKISLFAAAVCLVWCVFIFMADPTILGRDHYQMVDLFRSIGAGEKSIWELWTAKEGHRIPGYYFKFFLNLKLLGYHPLAEILPSVIIYSGVVAYLTSVFARSLQLPKWAMIVFCAAMVLIFMNAQNAQISAYSVIATRLLNFAALIYLSYLVYQFLWAENDAEFDLKKFVKVIVFAALIVLLLGRGWGISFVLSMSSVIVLNAFQKRRETDLLKRSFAVIAMLAVIVLIYMAGLYGKTQSSTLTPDLGRISAFFLQKLGSANLSVFQNGFSSGGFQKLLFSEQTVKQIGTGFGVLYVLFSMGLGLSLLLKKEMSLPVWYASIFVFFPIFAALSISVLRWAYWSPLSNRHNFELGLGMAGVFYFLATFVQGDRKLSKGVFMTLSGVAMACILLSWTNLYGKAEKHASGNSRKENFVRKAILGDASPQDMKRANCQLGEDRCRVVFRHVKENNFMPGVIDEPYTAPRPKRPKKPSGTQP